MAGIGEKTAATLLSRFGDMAGIVAAAADPDSDLGPGPRGKIKAAADYLVVAPEVVAVARDSSWTGRGWTGRSRHAILTA